MKKNKNSSSVFEEGDMIDLVEWLDISREDLEQLIGSADSFDLHRLHTQESKDALLESLLQKVWMKQVRPNMTMIPGGCDADGNMPGFDLNIDPRVWNYGKDKEIIVVEKAITAESCDEIKNYYLSQGDFSPVGVQGIQGGDGKVGSDRITCWDPEFAREMFTAIHSALDNKLCDLHTSTDWWQMARDKEYDKTHMLASLGNIVQPVSKGWKPVGVTPMVRFANYQAGGEHYAHYDAGYIYDNPRYRTLMSGVLYLTSNSSGATRFVGDGQEDQAVWERCHADHQQRTDNQSIKRIFYPDKGTVLLFDHRLCHDVQLYEGNEGDKTIIRFDVVFEGTDLKLNRSAPGGWSK